VRAWVAWGAEVGQLLAGAAFGIYVGRQLGGWIGERLFGARS